METFDFEDFRPPRPKRPSHGRKRLCERSNALWLESKVMECIDARNKDQVTYRKLKEDSLIPIGTIWNKVQSVKRGEPIRVKQGPHYKVPLSDEQALVEFLAECKFRQDPRSQPMVAEDIKHFLESYKHVNRFRRSVPGRGYFRRLKQFYPNVAIVSSKEVEEAALHTISVEDWVQERDEFLLSTGPGRFCMSLEAIYLIESGEIEVPGTNMKFLLLIAYGADGQIVNLFVIHKGDIDQDIIDQYSDKLYFVESEDGNLTFKCIDEAIKCIYRLARDDEINLPVIIYLNYDLYTYFGYGCWKFTKYTKMNVYRIPKSVFSAVELYGLGAFEKLQSLFFSEISKRYLKKGVQVTHDKYFKALCTVQKKGMSKHLKVPFEKMCLVTLEPEDRENDLINVTYIPPDVEEFGGDIDATAQSDHQMYDYMMRTDPFHTLGRPDPATPSENETTATAMSDNVPAPSTSGENPQEEVPTSSSELCANEMQPDTSNPAEEHGDNMLDEGFVDDYYDNDEPATTYNNELMHAIDATLDAFETKTVNGKN